MEYLLALFCYKIWIKYRDAIEMSRKQVLSPLQLPQLSASLLNLLYSKNTVEKERINAENI